MYAAGEAEAAASGEPGAETGDAGDDDVVDAEIVDEDKPADEDTK